MDKSQTAKQKKIEELILSIERTAGEIGVLDDQWLERAADSEEYEFQIHVGLADAAVSILKYNPHDLMFWLGYCLIRLGYDIDDRLQALIDSIKRELEVRDLSEEDSETED